MMRIMYENDRKKSVVTIFNRVLTHSHTMTPFDASGKQAV